MVSEQPEARNRRAPLRGAIIAAGRGERLRSAVHDLPKPLVQLGGETMLVRQARMLREAGADTVVALVNSETSALLAAGAVAIPPWMTLAARDTASSMESLFTLGEHLRGASHFLLATVDAVVEAAELRHFVGCALELTGGAEARFDGALAVVQWRGDERPLFAEVASDGAIAALSERESATVTAGFYYLPAAIFDLAGRARAEGLDAMRKLLAMALASGMRLGAIQLATTIDVDESADLAAARAMVAGAERSGGSRG
ncbi:MAG TPA: NTP transferase domain-containing protein [Candidatus Binataceae bacterium]|nr:NTP transferase domain-containing protein [Candidatus Binataceae bacterium]